MFLIQFFWGLIEVIAVAGSGLFLYRDYRNNFQASKAILSKLENGTKRILRLKQDNVALADDRVKGYAKKIHVLRESIAALEADRQISARKVDEQLILVCENQSVIEEALGVNNEDIAAVAAEAKLQAQTRMDLFKDHVKSLDGVVATIREKLEDAEIQFDILKSQAETVRVESAIAAAESHAYQLISDVSEAGFTEKGFMKELVENSQRKRIASGILVDMARKVDGGGITRFRRDAQVQKELEATREKMKALPASIPDIQAVAETTT